MVDGERYYSGEVQKALDENDQNNKSKGLNVDESEVLHEVEKNEDPDENESQYLDEVENKIGNKKDGSEAALYTSRNVALYENEALDDHYSNETVKYEEDEKHIERSVKQPDCAKKNGRNPTQVV